LTKSTLGCSPRASSSSFRTFSDGPAQAAANIGVAMGAAGSAVAVETADIALMGDNLLKLPEAISLARRTVANMRQNIAIALITVSLLMLGVLLGRSYGRFED
jgi:Cd2+/Zn2+-exporting ATPase